MGVLDCPVHPSLGGGKRHGGLTMLEDSEARSDTIIGGRSEGIVPQELAAIQQIKQLSPNH